jgi:IclR family transcriptional regulator, acetate operon repressor
MSLFTDQKYNVPGLDRALSIIELLNERTMGLSVNEVAAILKLPVNSVYRIMTTLERRKYVKKSKDGPGFILSEKLLQLATPVTGDPSFIESVIPYLYKLRDDTQESMLAGTFVNEEGIVLEQIDGLHNFSFKVKPGLRFPLHTSAPGKAFLASLPDTESKQIIARLKLTRFTPKTITTQAKLHKELTEVRQLGYAVDREEEMEGQICIGAVIKNKKNNIAGAIWLVAPSNRMDKQKIHHTGRLIKQSVDEISTNLGYLSLAVA